MRKASLAALVCALVAGSISAETPGTARQQAFTTTAGGIGCTYRPAEAARAGRPEATPAELACERIAPTYARIIMPAVGAPRIVAEAPEKPTPVTRTRLAQGGVWIGGPFACEAQAGGVTCTRGDGQKIIVTGRSIVAR